MQPLHTVTPSTVLTMALLLLLKTSFTPASCLPRGEEPNAALCPASLTQPLHTVTPSMLLTTALTLPSTTSCPVFPGENQTLPCALPL